MSALSGSHTQGSALEGAQRAEAEALGLLGMKTNRVLRTGNEEGWNGYLVDYAEAVRRTERLRVEALANAAERMNAILWRKDLIGFDYTAEYEDAAKQLQAALAAYRESQS